MGLRPTYMDETHLEPLSFDGVDGDSTITLKRARNACTKSDWRRKRSRLTLAKPSTPLWC